MFSFYENGWYFEDEDGFMHGPFETKEVAQQKYVARLEKQYVKSYDGDLVEAQG